MTIGDVPATVFSPSKVAYLSYVILTGLKILPTPSLWLFILLSFVFWISEVFHNDYLRVWLNKKAEGNQTTTHPVRC